MSAHRLMGCFAENLWTRFKMALAKVAMQKIMYYEIPAHTKEVGTALKEELAAQWRQSRGLEIQSMFLIPFQSRRISARS